MADFSNLTKNRNMAIVAVAVFLLIGLLVVLALRGGGDKKPADNIGTNNVVNIKSSSVNISIDGSNNLNLKTPSDLFSELWSKERVSVLITYLLENGERIPVQGGYVIAVTIDGVTTTLYIDADDELIGSIIDDALDDYSSGNDGDGDDDIGDYFDDSTPTPVSVPTPTPTPADGNGETGGPGEDYGHPECAYWRLSYCADPLPTPTSTPDQLVEDGVFMESYCEAWNELGIKSTIISNTVCIE